MANEKRFIPSNRWFPTNLAARVIWFQNFATQFAAVAASLGFLPADVASVQDDNTVFQFLGNDADASADAWKSALRQFRIIITEFGIGSPTPAFPANPALALPEVIATGIFQRLIELRDRILAAPAYTDEIGALLGILTSTPGPTPEGELKPTIEIFDNHGDFQFKADVSRKGMPMFKIQFARITDADNYTDIAFGSSNPITVTIPPLNPGQPERILVRAILLKNNEPVGSPSAIVQVTVNP